MIWPLGGRDNTHGLVSSTSRSVETHFLTMTRKVKTVFITADTSEKLPESTWHLSLEFCHKIQKCTTKRILTIVCATGGRVLERILSLRYVTICDLRVRGKLTVMIPTGVPVNFVVMGQLVEDSVHSVLCGSKNTEYNRSKWNGHEESIDKYLLADCLCGIGTEAYKRTAA